MIGPCNAIRTEPNCGRMADDPLRTQSFCSNPFAGTPECAHALCQRDEFATAMYICGVRTPIAVIVALLVAGDATQDYQEFLDQFQGTIDVEYRDLNIVATQWPLAAAWSG